MPFIKISGLTTATAVSATNQFEINQNGGSRSATVAQVAAFARTSATDPVVLPAGTVSAPALTFTGDTNTGIYSPAADTIAFTEGGVEAMRLDASGNVGIGTTAPTARLNIVDATSQDALRITQTGIGNALVVEDSANPDATPFAVDGNGVVIVGNTASQGQVPMGDGARYTPQTQMQGSVFGTSGLSATLFNAAAASGGGSLALNKSNTNTLGGQAVVASGDVLGTVFFNGSDGTNFVRGAQIQAAVDGTPGTNDMPGRLVFSTTADGAASPTERMRITAAGNVGVGDTNPTPVYGYTNVISVSSNYPGVQFNSAASSTLQKFQIGLGINSFQFYDGSAAAERMRIDASGNVGIGTSSPGARLGVSDGTVTLVTSPFAAGSTGYFGTSTNHPLALLTNNTERMRIDASGNVGIGSSTPNGRLQVAAGALGQFIVGFNGTSVNFTDVDTNIFRPAAGTTESMRIDASGNVGIGTSSPTGRLTVNGTLNFGNSAGTAMSISNDFGGNTFLTMAEGSSGLRVVNPSNTAEHFRIDASSGNVGLAVLSPAARLDIAGNMLLSGQSTAEQFIRIGSGRSANGFSYVDFQGDTTYANGLRVIRGNTGANSNSGIEHRGTGALQLVTYEAGSINFLTSSLERMRIAANGNVGIGTSGPAGPLDVVTGTNRIYFDDAGGAFARINAVNAANSVYNPIAINGSQVLLTTGTTERMRVDAAGNVGIGTSSPNYRLQSHNGSTTFNYIQITAANTGSGASDGMLVGTDSAADAIVWMFENTNLKFATNNTERMRIDASGNVGIGGPAAPGTRLEVVGPADATTSSSTGFGLRIRTPSGSGSPAILQFTNNPVTQQWGYISSPAQNVLTFGGNTERARITAGGEFLVGTTSTDPIGNASAGIVLRPNGIADFNASNNECLKVGRFGGTGTLVQIFYHNGSSLSVVGSISTNGSSTSYNTTSDYRLKENVTPLTGAAARVQALKPSRFNFIADPARTMDGFLAHEAAEVVPEAVTGEKDAVNEDGSIKAQGIDHSKLVPLLTAALQEALAEITSLKARVAILENK